MGSETTAMNIARSCNILIVGAGPAGVSTWLHLHKTAPLLADQSIVIDKAQFPRTKLCAGGVGAWSADVLKHLGIELKIPSLSISDLEFRYRDQTWVHHKQNAFRMVQRAEFDLALVKTAIDRGMRFKPQVRFLEVHPEHDLMVATTTDGQYRVKAIVGADGALSKVRRIIPRPHQSRLATTIQTSVPVNPEVDSEFHQKKMLVDFSAIDQGLQGYIWHFPVLENGLPFMNHGIGNFRIFTDRPKPDMKNLFRGELRQRLIDDDSVQWASSPIRWFTDNSSISYPHMLLVGDAAGIEPAFGGGIHMALSYGDLAARMLIRAFECGDFAFKNYRNMLMSHYLGRHIRDCTRLAKKIYSGEEEDVLNLVRQFFNSGAGRQNLLALLLNRGRGGVS